MSSLNDLFNGFEKKKKIGLYFIVAGNHEYKETDRFRSVFSKVSSGFFILTITYS